MSGLEATLSGGSGGSCRELQRVLGENRAAFSKHHRINIFDKLPKGILDPKDLVLEEYGVIYSSIINK